MVDALTAAALVLGVGVAAQVAARRIRIPSILLLLAGGWIVGPILGWVDPDELLGERLETVVIIGVAVLLFEGGLGLNLRELRGQGRVVTRLVTVGVLATWLIGAAAGIYLAGLDPAIAALLGAVVVVSGPTVVLPLLRVVQPTRRTDVILRWEGIVIDPIGALLAVVVFEALFQGGTLGDTASTIAYSVVAGLAAGGAAAWAFIQAEKRYLVSDDLVGAWSLGLLIAAVTVSEHIRPESGFFAATIMGLILANQRRVPVEHVLDFKGSLATILLGSLFVLLAARVTLADLAVIDARAFLWLGALVLVARPVTVLLSTFGTGTPWRERAFLMWMAPRGIVAAAVAAFFALRLEHAGVAGAEFLVPYTFLAVVGTVVLYGLTARPVARLLGVARPHPQGVLFVGANPVSRRLARVLHEEGFRTLLVDTNRAALTAARLDGLEAVHGNILSESLADGLDLTGIGRLWAVTPNEETNSLACVRFAGDFTRAHVYQVASDAEGQEEMKEHLRGRILFGGDVQYRVLRDRIQSPQWTVRRTKITEQFTLDDHRAEHGDDALPLWLITKGPGGSPWIRVFTTDHRPDARPGDLLVALVRRPEPDSGAEE